MKLQKKTYDFCLFCCELVMWQMKKKKNDMQPLTIYV